MAAISPASRLVTAAARKRLRPLGLRQRGRSRLWLDDHGWWLGVVEFPSPQWSQGSGLTVGVMWLWQDVGHVTFDFVERAQGSEPFRNEVQFASVAAELAGTAEEQVAGIRDRFADLNAVTHHLLSRPARPGLLWDSFNAGVAAGLVGDSTAARGRLTAVLAEDPFADWVREAQHTAQVLLNVADDVAALQTWARTAVVSCRSKLGLGDVPGAADALFV
ncbi:hypothetical protein ACWC3X_44625 [Streptomyces populi]